MDKLLQIWQGWEQKFTDLTQREKVILIVAAVFLSGFGLYKMMIEPGIMQMATLEKNKKKVTSELMTTNRQIADIENSLKIDPNEKIKQEIEVIRAEIAEVEAGLDAVMTEYIVPEQMASALTKLLQTSSAIRVVGMSALPPEKIRPNTDLTLPNYYRHQFKIEIEGNYFSLMDFVKKVSVNNSQFSVQNLNYVVKDHPLALLTLTLITISDNEKVIRL